MYLSELLFTTLIYSSSSSALVSSSFFSLFLCCAFVHTDTHPMHKEFDFGCAFVCSAYFSFMCLHWTLDQHGSLFRTTEAKTFNVCFFHRAQAVLANEFLKYFLSFSKGACERQRAKERREERVWIIFLYSPCSIFLCSFLSLFIFVLPFFLPWSFALLWRNKRKQTNRSVQWSIGSAPHPLCADCSSTNNKHVCRS